MHLKKFISILIIGLFLNSNVTPGYAYTGIPEYLCELGMMFYNQGRYDEALHEFKKALIAKPNYEPALKYIQMVEEATLPYPAPVRERLLPETFQPTAKTTAGAIKEMLDLIELQQEMIQYRQSLEPEVITPAPARIIRIKPKKEVKLPEEVIYLDELPEELEEPIEIQQGKQILIRGKNIRRFLLTQPEVLTVERLSPDELILTGRDIGYTYLHVWDDTGRRTLDFVCIYPKPEVPIYEEILRRETERARNFKLRYGLNWSSYESGRRLDDLERSNYSWVHSIGLSGPTPYGNFNSQASIRRSGTSQANLTYSTFSLLNGRWGSFKDFDIRGADFSPPVSNLAISGIGLRGVMLESPAFNKKLNYIAFWGREGGGRYGDLSPDLVKTRHSFLEGLSLDYWPNEKQDYRFTIVRGHGRDRPLHLNEYSYDLTSIWHLNNWDVAYEIGHDSENVAQLFNTVYKIPKLSLKTEFRNIDKDYFTISEGTWRQGELGTLFNLNYEPTEKFNITSRLDTYLDRLNPASDNNDRWNQDFDLNANYQFDPTASLSLNYIFQNQLGRLSQVRFLSPGFTIYKKFSFLRDIYTFFNYYHQENKNFTTPAASYVNERIYSGLRFNLIDELYYYVNTEFNWLKERQGSVSSKPKAWETGLSWSSRFGKSPFHWSLRFNYRDEEDTESRMSFLSGQDYIEGYSQLSYWPNNDTQIYGAFRVRNIWADNPSISKRIDVDFNAGLRYVWDTGVAWESTGNIEGHVFKDLNSDGLMQRDEAPIEGVKIWLGKDKFQVTDIFGYYKFKNVRGQKVYVNLDTSSLPGGFISTVPVTQGVNIEQSRIINVDFGISSRTEITGIVFEDVDGNAEFSKPDKGVSKAIITLEDGKEAVTDDSGRYYFRNFPIGEHTISLDLKSIPVYYLPEVPITKEIVLFEGVTYIYNIPLKRIEGRE